MPRNRKSDSGFRLSSACAALFLCALFASLGVGYVWFKNQIGVLGAQIRKDEIRLADLERDNRVRRDQLAALCSPIALDDRVKKLNLGLAPASLVQVIHLNDLRPDSSPETPRPDTFRMARNN